jgi:hypothetical protein
VEWARSRHVVCRAPDGAGGTVPVREGQLGCVFWDPPADDRPWRLRIFEPDPRPSRPAILVSTLEGAEAATVAARVLARLNRREGAEADLRRAVDLIESVGDPFESNHAARAALQAASPRARLRASGGAGGQPSAAALGALLPAHRLAMEIAANESTERRAMEGELAALEAAWRDAEEIAAIADRL